MPAMHDWASDFTHGDWDHGRDVCILGPVPTIGGKVTPMVKVERYIGDVRCVCNV